MCVTNLETPERPTGTTPVNEGSRESGWTFELGKNPLHMMEGVLFAPPFVPRRHSVVVPDSMMDLSGVFKKPSLPLGEITGDGTGSSHPTTYVPSPRPRTSSCVRVSTPGRNPRLSICTGTGPDKSNVLLSLFRVWCRTRCEKCSPLTPDSILYENIFVSVCLFVLNHSSVKSRDSRSLSFEVPLT